MLGFDAIGRLALGQLPSVTFTTPSIQSAPLSEPIRQRIAPRLAVALAASGLFAPVLNPNTQIIQNFESRWHQPWSEPIRYKTLPRLQVVLAASGSFSPVFNPTIEPGSNNAAPWIYAWSLPVRIKPGIKVGDQPFFFFQPKPVVTFSYYNWLTEPVRQKLGLKAPLQQFATQDTQWIPVPSKFEEGWFNWLSEPVRLPRGLKAWLQQTLAYHPRILPTPNVTITLAATEINNNVAQFGIVLYNQAVRCDVSVKEVAVTKAANLAVRQLQTTNSGAAAIQQNQATNAANTTINEIAATKSGNASIEET